MRRRDAGLSLSVRGRRRLLVAAGAALVSAPLFVVPAAASSIDPRHVTARGFTTSFGAMDQFRKLTAAGHGPVGVLLPNSYTAAIVGAALVKSLQTAGLKKSQFEVQNAGGSDATQLGDAETDIAQGSRVLLVDPINSGVGTQIEVEAQTKGVKTIDFDNLSLGGSRNYYVGYDQVTAGHLLVKGLASCSTAWHVTRPRLLVLPGPANDGTASQLEQGYNAALQSLVDTHGWTVAAQTAGTSDPPTAASEFQAAYRGEPRSERRPRVQRRDRHGRHRRVAGRPRRAPHLPHHRHRVHADRAAEHPQWLPVRHGGHAARPRSRPRPSLWPCTSGPGSAHPRASSMLASRTPRLPWTSPRSSSRRSG